MAQCTGGGWKTGKNSWGRPENKQLSRCFQSSPIPTPLKRRTGWFEKMSCSTRGVGGTGQPKRHVIVCPCPRVGPRASPRRAQHPLHKCSCTQDMDPLGLCVVDLIILSGPFQWQPKWAQTWVVMMEAGERPLEFLWVF